MARMIDVEVTVTSTVTYRIPRPTKAEVVDDSGPDAWDSDDPESSIRDYLEGQGIEDLVKGVKPQSVSIDEMELVDVYPV